MKLKNILNEKIEEWILVTSLIFIVLLVFFQVVSRYVLDFQMGWSNELSRYILIWIAWISASFAVHKNAHIRVELLINMLSGKAKKILELIVLIIWFSFALFLALIGTKFILMIREMGQVSPSLGLPMELVYMAAPIAGILMCIRLIQQAILIFQK